jgi:hypothetical protein
MQGNEEIYDVAVIGGGPAGMMAAGRAKERGLRVALIEKNHTLGKKLLITGGGRCNMTNDEPDVRKFLEKFKDSGKFLFSAFSQWGVKETLDFFHARKLETKVEEYGRVFPSNDKAESVFGVLIDHLKEDGGNGSVSILTGDPVKEMSRDGSKIEAVLLGSGKKIRAGSFILASGGKSRPETGSTGDGFVWLKDLGHTVIPPNPSLVPIAIKDGWVKALQGVTIPDVKITAFQNGVKQIGKKGKILFTHFGVSGPTIINMSREVGELLKYGDVALSLDIFPALGYDALNAKLQALLKENSNKKFKNALGELVPAAALQPILARLSEIDPETFCHSITREERLALVKAIKGITMQVEGLLGAEKAIVTSGGVSLAEVDFKAMRSRLFSNLYFAGDILDIDRPSGGYSLQLCWTTGYVAGNSVKNNPVPALL